MAPNVSHVKRLQAETIAMNQAVVNLTARLDHLAKQQAGLQDPPQGFVPLEHRTRTLPIRKDDNENETLVILYVMFASGRSLNMLQLSEICSGRS